MRRVGHAGTLDPDASGLLLICVGEATKIVPFLMTEQKDYRCSALLGSETLSDDAAGEVIRTAEWEHITETAIHDGLARFRGGYEQTAPRVSALKKDGKRFHERVRAGEEVDDELPTRAVKVHDLGLTGFDAPEFELAMTVGKGFYVRSIVRDLGRLLDSAAHVRTLRRTRVGDFTVDNAISIDDFASASAVPLSDALGHLPSALAGPIATTRFRHGQRVPLGDDVEVDKRITDGERVRILDHNRALIAVAECIPHQVLRVVRGFNATT
jgi:tRNA pseudouridine55 synthase